MVKPPAVSPAPIAGKERAGEVARWHYTVPGGRPWCGATLAGETITGDDAYARRATGEGQDCPDCGAAMRAGEGPR